MAHRWKFFRAGGVDQVVFRDGKDIVHLDELDQKLWMALACPAKGLELDKKTLEHLDADKDGRVRAREVLAAVAWVKDTRKNPDELIAGGDSVALASIDDRSAAGKALLAGAKRILHDLGKPQATKIALADVATTDKIFAATRLNGDAIVPADAAEDPATKQVIADVIATHGSVADRSGKPGVDQPRVEAFFAEAAKLVAWSAEGEDVAVKRLGDATPAAFAAYQAVEAKVEDWFTRARLAAFDSRAAGPLNRAETEFAALATKDLTLATPEIQKLPLARVEGRRPLPLADGVNPAWSKAVEEFSRLVVTPLVGERSELSLDDWTVVKDKLAKHAAWVAAKPATAVEKLGLPRLREVVASDAKARVLKLIEQDKALESEFAQIASVEKMLLFQRDLVRFLNNFVNFSEFYARKGATFQVGTLYLDGRSMNLVVRVEDAGKHAALAGLAKSYLVYCDCVRAKDGAKMTIVAAMTDGDSDHLMVGRNGVFYDREGGDWDATVTKIVENPISIREAFWAPYKRFVRMIEEQVAKRAAAADAASTEKLSAAATATAQADATKEEPAPAAKGPAPAKKVDVGTVAALGVAIAGLATFLSTILAAFFGLGRWMPVGVAGIVLAISGPSMLIAWLKLRQRSLAPILDANGWAVNGRVVINVPFGAALTSLAKLPKGSERSLDDPYAEKRVRWKRWVVLAALVVAAVLWYRGKLDEWLPAQAHAKNVIERIFPADPAAVGSGAGVVAPPK